MLGRYGPQYSSVFSGVMAVLALIMGLAAAPHDAAYYKEEAAEAA